MPDKFILHSNYKPTGDQPEAIEKLVEGLENGLNAPWDIVVFENHLYILDSGNSRILELDSEYNLVKEYADKNDIVVRKNNSGLSDKELINSLSQVDDMRKPRYDDLKKAYTKAYKNGEASIVDNNHNLVFAVGVIFNFTKTYRDMIIEY